MNLRKDIMRDVGATAQDRTKEDLIVRPSNLWIPLRFGPPKVL